MIEKMRDFVCHIRPAAAWLTVAILCLSLTSCATFKNWQAGGEYDKGIALFNQGKYREATPHFEKAAEIDPNYYSAYLYLGRCYLNLKQYTNAVQHLRTAYRLSPGEFKKEIFDILLDALFGAAMSEVKQDNANEAINYFKEVLTLDPRSDKAKDELVRLYITGAGDLLQKGNIDDAVRTYSEVLKISPDNVTAYLGLITAFVKSGNISRALEAAEKAHILDPNSKEILRILKELIVK
jgi:tetratricopeptide (TPR) repeat protein